MDKVKVYQALRPGAEIFKCDIDKMISDAATLNRTEDIFLEDDKTSTEGHKILHVIFDEFEGVVGLDPFEEDTYKVVSVQWLVYSRRYKLLEG